VLRDIDSSRLPEIYGGFNHMTKGWRQNSWVIPISAAMLAVLIISVPPFLRFDPATTPAQLNLALPILDFVLAEAHVLFGTVAIVTLCLNIWPWLRIRHAAVHRWSGRVYVFSALSASLLILPIVYLNNTWGADIGAYATGGFWFVTTLIGYLAIRQRNEVRHRRWMLYSFAMATSVAWGVVLTPFFSEPAQFPYMFELLRWVGPLVNLGAVKWWLYRTAARGATVSRGTRSSQTVVQFPTAAQRDHIRRRAA
jgi:predicted membrane protein DUF2306